MGVSVLTGFVFGGWTGSVAMPTSVVLRQLALSMITEGKQKMCQLLELAYQGVILIEIMKGWMSGGGDNERGSEVGMGQILATSVIQLLIVLGCMVMVKLKITQQELEMQRTISKLLNIGMKEQAETENLQVKSVEQILFKIRSLNNASPLKLASLNSQEEFLLVKASY